VRVWPLVAAIVGVPLLAGAAAAPNLPRGFAGERFAPVVRKRGLPVSDWRAVEGYLHWKALTDLGDAPASPRGGSSGATFNMDFGETPARGPCVRRIQPDPTRVFALAGLGARFDFIIYRHSPSGPDVPGHDHHLVFRRVVNDRVLAFSCVGKLPRRVGEVAAAVSAGRCREETGPLETD
jgi:hypothetical protein